jgi:hypothetical protein
MALTLSPKIRAHSLDVTTAQARLVIAETIEAVDCRFEKNEEDARSLARQYRKLAAHVADGMFDVPADAPRGAAIVVIYRAIEALATIAPSLRASFRSFCKDYGNFVDDDTKSRIERICDGAIRAADGLRPAWLGYLETFRTDLNAGIEEELTTLDEWSSVDDDDLNDNVAPTTA